MFLALRARRSLDPGLRARSLIRSWTPQASPSPFRALRPGRSWRASLVWPAGPASAGEADDRFSTLEQAPRRPVPQPEHAIRAISRRTVLAILSLDGLVVDCVAAAPGARCAWRWAADCMRAIRAKRQLVSLLGRLGRFGEPPMPELAFNSLIFGFEVACAILVISGSCLGMTRSRPGAVCEAGSCGPAF